MSEKPLTLSIVTVDAFTNRPFKGNPAAVLLLPEAIDEQLMKNIASEMNLAETAFAHPIKKGEDLSSAQKWSLRWLTPLMEVDLCGHATLATAHVICDVHKNTNANIEFATRSGSLFVSRHNKAYAMDFPIFDHQNYCTDGAEIAKAAACNLTIKAIHYSPEIRYMFAVIDEKHSDDDLQAIAPDFDRLARLLTSNADNVLCCAVTKQSDSAFDYVCRFFATPMGLNEDPATGSLQCVLAPYWSKVLNKEHLFAKQLYPNRGAEFELILPGNDRIKIIGQAVTIVKGTIDIDAD